MNKVFIFIVSVLIPILNNAQEGNFLSYKEYIKIVSNEHPIIRKISLMGEKAVAQKRIARGGFDPKIEGNWSRKDFDDKDYFNLGSGVLKVPTWFGIDIKAGYDRNSGQFLNNSDIIPSRGLWNAGISIPLGKGLVIDERRAALKRADLIADITNQEQKIIINNLLYEASLTYLDWQVAAERKRIAEEGVALANVKAEGTKKSLVNGDKPAVDTLEAFIAIQSRSLDLQKANQIYENILFEINNYLWIGGEIPLEVEKDIDPDTIGINQFRLEADEFSIIQDQWLPDHPQLLLYDYKIRDVGIDQRLAREELKPDLRVFYNPLVTAGDNRVFEQFRTDDLKIGAQFSYPILQRKERGKIDMNKLKIEEAELDKRLKRQELSVKLNVYANNINQSQDQYRLLSSNVENYSRLLVAENRKYSIGESSIFLVNSRELKYLDSQYKLLETSQKLIFNRITYLSLAQKLEESIPQ